MASNPNTYAHQILARIEKFLKERGETFADLAKNIYVSKGYFYTMKNNNSTVGSEVLSRICLFYSDLSADWLLTGRGEMLKSSAVLKKEAIAQTKELNKKLKLVRDMLKSVRTIENGAEMLSAQAAELLK